MSCVAKHIMLVLVKDKYMAVNQCLITHRFAQLDLMKLWRKMLRIR